MYGQQGNYGQPGQAAGDDQLYAGFNDFNPLIPQAPEGDGAEYGYGGMPPSTGVVHAINNNATIPCSCVNPSRLRHNVCNGAHGRRPIWPWTGHGDGDARWNDGAGSDDAARHCDARHDATGHRCVTRESALPIGELMSSTLQGWQCRVMQCAWGQQWVCRQGRECLARQCGWAQRWVCHNREVTGSAR
eukprot:SAG11_NODE_1269_length_5341_cov_7.956696_2_plen_189_part_00